MTIKRPRQSQYQRIRYLYQNRTPRLLLCVTISWSLRENSFHTLGFLVAPAIGARGSEIARDQDLV